MNKLDVAVGASSAGLLTIAGTAMTSDEAQGWLGVIDWIVNRPGGILVLLCLIGLLMLWFILRGARNHAECEARNDRTDALVMVLLRDHPQYDVIVRNWDDYKAGKKKLDDILGFPERRQAKRRLSDRRQDGFLLMEAVVAMSITSISVAGLWTAVAQARIELRKVEAAIGRFERMLLCYSGSNTDACTGLMFVDYTTGCEYELGAGSVRKRSCVREAD